MLIGRVSSVVGFWETWLTGVAGEGAMSAVSRIYGNIGFMGLWNGLGVRIVMLGTLTGFQWLM